MDVAAAIITTQKIAHLLPRVRDQKHWQTLTFLDVLSPTEPADSFDISSVAMSRIDVQQQPETAVRENGRGHGAVAEYIAQDLRALAVPIETLHHAPDNARRHADADLNGQAESLRLHRQCKPVVAKRMYRGIVNAVLAGNGTLASARRLGWSHLAVTWFEGTDDEAREFAIRDNRTAELSAWDADRLSALQAQGVDLLALWHDDAALVDLLGENAPTPRFEPEPHAHRLDELAAHCSTCTCRQRRARP